MTPLDMLARLVAFDTTSRGSNLALIDFVRDWLARQGIDIVLVPNAAGDKANLIASIGPAVPGGVVLSGHTDVVPVDGQDWASDPFSLSVRDGRAYGRGTCDMKGFLACALAAVPAMVTAKLARPIHLALSYDEEVGCLGAPDMIERIVADLPRPRAVIVGEPTDMRVVTGHKGIAAQRTVVTGKSVHSSQHHRGVSAVMVAARLVNQLMAMEAALRHDADPTNGFDPPWTSIHVGTMRGGTAVNIVAAECAFDWDVRAVPGVDAAAIRQHFAEWCAREVEPAMRAIDPDCGIVTIAGPLAPGLTPRLDCPAAELARRLTGDNGDHRVAYAAEAGQFQAAGLAVCICGPGSIDQAHQADEYVDLDQLAAASQFIDRLIAEQSRA